MVADQPEDVVLGEDGGLIIERAIAKVKGETGGDTIAMGDLNEITRGEDSDFARFKDEESVKGSLCATYRNRVAGHPRGCHITPLHQNNQPIATSHPTSYVR